MGINGMKFYCGDIYFSNTVKGLYGMISIDRATGQPTGKPCLLANYGTYVAEFSIVPSEINSSRKAQEVSSTKTNGYHCCHERNDVIECASWGVLERF